MFDFTFLTDEQIYGDDKLEIFKRKKYGADLCEITDFSILLGGSSSKIVESFKTGYWWTKDSYDSRVISVQSSGNIWDYSADYAWCGARPALPYSSIRNISSNKVRGKDGILEVEYGEYPQTVVSGDLAKKLEELYSNGKIKQTGKIYTTADFEYQTHLEYEYNGKKYIRIENTLWDDTDGAVLSDGSVTRWCSSHWIEVEPIKWLIDEKNNIALSEKILFSGVQFDTEKKYNGDFDKTYIKWFMDEYFSKDIVPNRIYKKHEAKEGQRPGIRVSNINVEKIQEIVEERANDLELQEKKEEPENIRKGIKLFLKRKKR